MEIIEGTVSTPIGFTSGALHVGLKKVKKDLGIVYSDVPANVAGVFTTNKVKAATIAVTKAVVASGKMQAVVVNSGIANACTGKQGLQDAKDMGKLTAEKFGIDASLVGVGSTGVIGKLLPMDIVSQGISDIEVSKNDTEFAKAILTTDTLDKNVCVTEIINGAKVTIAACAKGSGMIHPNLATMLSFITTDANISSELIQKALSELTEVTFNQITIDGDTSTNDMVLVLANGQAKNAEITEQAGYVEFKEMLQFIMETIAKKIAKDGEGATKLIEVTVTGAKTTADARMAAKAVVGSSLVKTAIFGKDPNWGRILCALGYSTADFDPEEAVVKLAGQTIYEKGEICAFDAALMEQELDKDEVLVDCHLNAGDAFSKAWGCDLTYEYVKINALYTT